MTFFSCKPDKEKEFDYSSLQYAQCVMDIRPQNKTKTAVDIIGDSVAVHNLSRYLAYVSALYVGPDFFGDTVANIVTCRNFQNNLYMRLDTINHACIFFNDAVVCQFTDHHKEEDYYALGWAVSRQDYIFCAYYDTENKRYFDPLNATDRDWLALDSTLPEWNGKYYAIDTLGYIPNSQVFENLARLERLMAEEKIEEMLELFKSDYHIYTCTGEEYRELVRLGLN